MAQPFEDMQKASQEGMDVAASSFSNLAKGFQAVAADQADYAKRSFESSSATLERMFSVKSWDQAIQIQTDYLRSTYEGLVSQSTKVGEMMTDLAREAYKPYETMFSRAAGR